MLWLVGMMGSGKTSAGRLAASNLGVPFADTDQLVVDRSQTTIAGLWAEGGEQAFRDVEREVVAALEEGEGVVSTGGGVVLDPANRSVLRRSGTVVWLDASVPVLMSRIGSGEGRPLVAGGVEPPETVLSTTLEERAPLYREVADHRIETDGLDTDATAARIEAIWRS